MRRPELRSNRIIGSRRGPYCPKSDECSGRVFPRASEFAQPVDGQMSQLPMPAMRAEGEELAGEEPSALLDCRGREIGDGRSVKN